MVPHRERSTSITFGRVGELDNFTSALQYDLMWVRGAQDYVGMYPTPTLEACVVVV